MIQWYEQGLDWLIAHTSIEMAFCLFIVAVAGMIVWTLWLLAILRDDKNHLHTDLEIFEAIQEMRRKQ